MAPEGQLRLDPRLEDRPAALLQAQDLGLGERLEREIGQRRAAPQVERGPEALGRLLGRGRAGASNQTVEVVEIALVTADVQEVGAAMRLEPPVAAQRLPQRRD